MLRIIKINLLRLRISWAEASVTALEFDLIAQKRKLRNLDTRLRRAYFE
jgi:hypothetical protein